MGLKFIPNHTETEKLDLNETEEENDARVQEQRPPFTGITQQTVYQHESHMTAWLLTSEDSFIVTNTNTAVWSCCLHRR